MNQSDRKYIIRSSLLDCWRSPSRKKLRICSNHSSTILVVIGSIHILEILKAIRESTWPPYCERIIPQRIEIYNIPHHIKVKTLLNESRRRLKQWHKQRNTYMDWSYWDIQWDMLRQDILHERIDKQINYISMLRLFEEPPKGVEECGFTLYKAQNRKRIEAMNMMKMVKKMNTVDT